ncbi:Unconventional myosin heavy chain 6 [Gossypium arboreum]|uniref:Unconventional myosin heavy chain 6 n=1 Tax=Gossypium arboreum TaxID=29729 RepID=A0A0B0MC85_GOSAR|nr:Unconventional myosin heavy chain 6 [Gossypium arboreum]
MMLYTVKVIYPIHQLLVPYLFELRFLLTSKYTSHTHIVHHSLRIKVCHAMNITNE